MAEAESAAARALNIELTRLLVETGRAMGFDVRTEYPVPGGRLDVAWTWSPPRSIPGVDEPLPVVVFELESSWRTRKHVKGDLLNLQDAAVSLGVIVLAGADPKDDSLRRFAAALVDRPGSRVLVWTGADVRALASGVPTKTALAEEAARAAGPAPALSAEAPSPPSPAVAGIEHTGKYRPLWEWLRRQEGRDRSLSFSRSRRSCGSPCPTPVARTPLTGTATRAAPWPGRSSTPAGTRPASTFRPRRSCSYPGRRRAVGRHGLSRRGARPG